MRSEILLRRNWISAWPGNVSLVEPSHGSTPGFPDAFCIAEVSAGMVEFKALDDKGMFTFEPTQRLWLIQNVPTYRHVAIVTLTADGFYTIPARHIVRKGMPLQHRGDIGTRLDWATPLLSLSLLGATLRAWGSE